MTPSGETTKIMRRPVDRQADSVDDLCDRSAMHQEMLAALIETRDKFVAWGMWGEAAKLAIIISRARGL